MRWALGDSSVIAVETALGLDYYEPATRHLDRVIVPIVPTRRLPLFNEVRVLHMAADASDEITLWLHRGGLLSAKTFDGSLKNAAEVKLRLRQSVSSKFVRFGSQDLCKVVDCLFEISALLTRDDC